MADVAIDTLKLAVKENILAEFERVAIVEKISKFKIIMEHGDRASRKLAKKQLKEIKKKTDRIEKRVLAVKPFDRVIWFFQDLTKVLAYYMSDQNSLYYFEERVKYVKGLIAVGSLGEGKITGVQGDLDRNRDLIRDNRAKLIKSGMQPAYTEDKYNEFMGIYKEFVRISCKLDAKTSYCNKYNLHKECDRIREDRRKAMDANHQSKIFKITRGKLSKYVIKDPYLVWDESFLFASVSIIRILEEYIKNGDAPKADELEIKRAIKRLKKFLIFIEDKIREIQL